MSHSKPYLIVNPASAAGKTGRHFDRIARAVRSAVGAFECAFTRWRGEATDLAKQAVRSGGRFVVAVGGDGTASEVIDGLISSGKPIDPEVLFGCIPRGTGGDLRRTLGWSMNPEEAARTLVEGTVRVCDVGHVEYVGHDGKRHARHFANAAGCGVSGVVVAEAEKGWKVLGGKLGFMLASARGLLGYQDQPVRWRVDDGEWHEERVTSLEVCNGRYFGGGMMVAPDALIDDGLLDVTVWKGLGFADFITKKGMLYDGSHVKLPNTRTCKARVVEVEPLDGARVLLEADGEQPGILPARFTIVPGALKLRVRR